MQNQHSELILDFGVEIAQNHSAMLDDLLFVTYIEEFFMAALDLK
jgi:hypothetical protein